MQSTGILRLRRQRVVSAVWRLALLALVSLAMAVEGGGTPRALLVGMSYQGAPHVSALPGIDLDINRMEQVARDLGITDIRKLWNEEATLGGIRGAIRALSGGVGPDDLVLLYYSGHGTRVPDKGNKDEADGLDEALVPFDAKPAGDDLENALADDEFGQLLGDVATSRLVLVVDSCHSGTAAKSIGVGAVSTAFVYTSGIGKGLLLPSSGSPGPQPSTADGDARFIGIMAAEDHESAVATPRDSILTSAAHEIVSVAVREGDDALTVEELFDRVAERAAEETARLKVSNPEVSQHPSLFVAPGSEGMQGLLIPLHGGAASAPRLDPPEDDPLINEWMAIAEGARQRIEIEVPRETFLVHSACTGTGSDCDEKYSEHLLSIEVVAPEDGYLNLVSVGQGESDPVVLFPNGKSRQDNQVKNGQKITLPPAGAKWCLPASSVPAGMDSHRVLVVAAFSDRELNFHEDGLGEGPFRKISAGSARNFSVSEAGQVSADKPGVSAVATAHVLVKRK